MSIRITRRTGPNSAVSMGPVSAAILLIIVLGLAAQLAFAAVIALGIALVCYGLVALGRLLRTRSEELPLIDEPPEPELTGDELVREARDYATDVHLGQTDKAGRPYIGHPTRIAARLKRDGYSAHVQAVGWLHDVLEDSDITYNDLAEQFGTWVADPVWLLTRRPDVSSADYYAAIRRDPTARVVKLYDIADNADPKRLNLLDEITRTRLERKYADAKEAVL